jgi:L-alanine-DL-glutamate epimerase-like enolase superfamily enzyme
MKITRITPILADGGHRIFVFVKVGSDQPGLIGWGEATLEGKPPLGKEKEPTFHVRYHLTLRKAGS